MTSDFIDNSTSCVFEDYSRSMCILHARRNSGSPNTRPAFLAQMLTSSLLAVCTPLDKRRTISLVHACIGCRPFANGRFVSIHSCLAMVLAINLSIEQDGQKPIVTWSGDGLVQKISKSPQTRARSSFAQRDDLVDCAVGFSFLRAALRARPW